MPKVGMPYEKYISGKCSENVSNNNYANSEHIIIQKIFQNMSVSGCLLDMEFMTISGHILDIQFCPEFLFKKFK